MPNLYHLTNCRKLKLVSATDLFFLTYTFFNLWNHFLPKFSKRRKVLLLENVLWISKYLRLTRHHTYYNNTNSCTIFEDRFLRSRELNVAGPLSLQADVTRLVASSQFSQRHGHVACSLGRGAWSHGFESRLRHRSLCLFLCVVLYC
jgi:hypothetical protein